MHINKFGEKKVKKLDITMNLGKIMELKIGIHYGRVIAGVIGEHKP